MADEPQQLSLPRRYRWTISAGIAVVFLESMHHGPELVHPIAGPWRYIIMIIGFIGGIPLARFLARHGARSEQFKALMAAALIPIFCMSIASYYARRVVEAYAFTGFAPNTERVFVPIVNINGGRGPDSATVRTVEPPRDIRVYVTDKLMLRLDAYRNPGRDCLILDQETGRNNIKRLNVPGFFDKEIDTVAFRRCSAQ